MANRTGYRGEPWTPSEAAKLAELMVEGSSVRQMALTLKRPKSSIEGKIRSIRQKREMGEILGPGLARYEAPPFRLNDERKHLVPILEAGGFTWLVCRREAA